MHLCKSALTLPVDSELTGVIFAVRKDAFHVHNRSPLINIVHHQVRQLSRI